MGGGQGHDGDPETAPGGVVPHAGALPDDPTAALAVAAGEGVDDGRPGGLCLWSQTCLTHKSSKSRYWPSHCKHTCEIINAIYYQIS